MGTKGRDEASPETARPPAGGPLTAASVRRLPAAPREPKPALAALAVLLILGGALATTVLVMRADERVSAILITKQVGAGQPLGPDSMREARVVEDGVKYALWADRARVSNTVAAVTLLPGTLVTTAMTVGRSKGLLPGMARVGLALKPGQSPSGMYAGCRVQVVLVPTGTDTDAEQSQVLAQSALVDSVGTSGNRATGLVTVIVDSDVAPAIAAYASAGQIAITDLPGLR
ncbi:hypothetical protein [Nonomuraea sp. NPDC002799]